MAQDTTSHEKRNPAIARFPFLVGRDEATRTPDPYVPNVVRYQLRYIPKTFEVQGSGTSAARGDFFKSAAKLRRIFELRATFPKFFCFKGIKCSKGVAMEPKRWGTTAVQAADRDDCR